MRALMAVTLGCLSLVTISGCRATAQVKAVPRVDIAVENQPGNRGYLTGNPPPAKPIKATREILEISILIPGYTKEAEEPNPSQAKDVANPGSKDEHALYEYPPIESAAFKTPDEYDTYIVQKGDSLWSIAAKSDVYGKATQWRIIYEANRDRLKTPDSVNAGMEIRIPRGGLEGTGTTYDDEGSIFKK